jgi:hypothetical protein
MVTMGLAPSRAGLFNCQKSGGNGNASSLELVRYRRAQSGAVRHDPKHRVSCGRSVQGDCGRHAAWRTEDHSFDIAS